MSLALDRHIENLKNWLELNSQYVPRWWKFRKKSWHKGYTEACQQALELLENDKVSLLKLNDYRALEGYYRDIHMESYDQK